MLVADAAGYPMPKFQAPMLMQHPNRLGCSISQHNISIRTARPPTTSTSITSPTRRWRSRRRAPGAPPPPRAAAAAPARPPPRRGRQGRRSPASSCPRPPGARASRVVRAGASRAHPPPGRRTGPWAPGACPQTPPPREAPAPSGGYRCIPSHGCCCCCLPPSVPPPRSLARVPRPRPEARSAGLMASDLGKGKAGRRKRREGAWWPVPDSPAACLLPARKRLRFSRNYYP